MNRRGRRVSLLAHGALAVAVYPALLVTQIGRVAADSKPLLFIDAGRFMSRVPYLWDPTIGLGTVTHQNLGYLLPMGPWFWLTEQLGVPVWLSQRLWLGTLLLVAGAGVLFLARTMRWNAQPGPTIAALGYALSPFVAQYATHLSVLLLPYAALPWLVGITLRAVREGGWRWPARFAIVIAVVGTVNATTVACILVGPAVTWVIEFVRSRPGRRRASIAAVRMVGLSMVVSLWWVVALLIESRFGIDVLASSETLETVTLTTTAPEILRGLGYWFLYGRDAVAPYLDAGRTYMATWVLPASFLPVLLAAPAAAVARWRRRTTYLALLIVGSVLAIGAHPYANPSAFGSLFTSILEGSDVARALRSISRITPLVALAVAVLLGVGVTALQRRAPSFGRIAAWSALLAIALAIAPLWTGQLISSTRTRPETIPTRWRAATSSLDEAETNTRVLELPGIDFAAYRWGYTNDSITRGLMDRPTVAREVVPYGTQPSVDLVTALDRRVQERTFDPDALPEIARLLAASSILVRGDVQSSRYDLPAATSLLEQLDPLPAGVSRARTFGARRATELSVLDVENARRIVRAESNRDAIILSGSGEGLVDAVEAGVPIDDRLIVYSGSLAGHAETATRLFRGGAEVVVTDSNRKRASRSKTLYDNSGFTERIGEEPLRPDREDSRADLFGDSGDDSRSVTIVDGATATATSYGNPVTLVPSQRPMLAIDGDPSTAWRTGDFWRVRGERLRIDLVRRTTADQVTLLQPPDGNRHITRVRVSFDGDSSVDADLDPSSLGAPGQVIEFPSRTFRELGIEILETDVPERVNNGGLTGVGFAEVIIPGVDPSTEVVRLPRDIVRLSRAAPTEFTLTYVLSRARTAPDRAPEQAPELTLAREFEVPTDRAFELRGVARDVGSPVAASGECRADLLTLDGAPLPIRIGPTAVGTLERSISTCVEAPLSVAAGRHVVTSADGRSTGVTIDRLVLRSGSDTPPETRASGTATAAATPRIRVHRPSPTAIDVDVRDATSPFWLVLGESHSDGWHATIGSDDLGPPTLVDGYANGWYIDPRTTPRLGVEVRWTPQRWVWLSLALSAVALLGCLVLAARRRPIGAADDVDDPPFLPTLRSKPFTNGPTPGTRTTALVALGVLLGVSGIAGPISGLVVAAITVAGLRSRIGSLLPEIAAVIAIGGSAVFIVAAEVIHRYPADFPWPASFDAVHPVALTGVLLFASGAVVDWARKPRRP